MQDECPVASSSTVTLDSPPLLLATRLEPIYESDEDSPPLVKCPKCTCQNQIMALPTDHWNKEDLIDIYGSEAENDNEGVICMCSSVLHWLCPQLVVKLIHMCGSVQPCNEKHCNCLKCVHWCEKFMNHWILDSGASMHFTPWRDAIMTYHKFSKDKRLPVQTAASTMFVEGKGTIQL